MPIQRRVADLPAVTGVTGTDLLIMSSSSATKRVSVSQIGSYFQTAGVAGPTGPTSAYQGATAPADAPDGALWLDTDSGSLFFRYADVWIEVGGKHYP